ncbi:prepilin peptidase [Jannaschia sp. S6380]|uniref:prepilin peptidase n=1 Tax=Jannaschia sp. S6380 TaxID=2926408 RepID=UPI001FF62316|nr:prepilin peptidase [Jannaschia sp. S6380]MCK0169289.1 prepilin peptidase [Jannaschia sp. S6380]
MEGITTQVLAATPMQGIVFGLLSIPVCLWVAYTDLSEMKIRNEAVLALFAIFAVAGPFLMPFDVYLSRYLHLLAILMLGFGLATIGAMGAGDAKFAAAMAPFVAFGDVAEIMVLFAVLLVLTWTLHRSARMVEPVRNLAPGWKSWAEPKAFPMGITLASTQLSYLAMAALL